MNMIEKVADSIARVNFEFMFGRKPDSDAELWRGLSKTFCEKEARAAIEAMRDPSDELLLAPGEPYRIQKAVYVSREEGIELRRKAWNKIIDAALKEE